MSAAVSARAGMAFDVALFRDDGPVSRAIGRTLGPRLHVPAMAALTLGPLGALAFAFIAGEGASLGVTAAGVAWLVLTLGYTSARWPKQSFHWAVPSLVRLGEYTTLAWLAATADALPAAFALLAVLAFRHYDLAYRLRHRGETPPAWLNALAAGWDGRVILAWVLLAAGLLPAAMYVWAALLAVVSVTETVVAWRRFGRGIGSGDLDENDVEGD
jgi:Family of unknown function (DUF5941)